MYAYIYIIYIRRGRDGTPRLRAGIIRLLWLYLDAEVWVLPPLVLSSGLCVWWLPIFVDIQLLPHPALLSNIYIFKLRTYVQGALVAGKAVFRLRI